MDRGGGDLYAPHSPGDDVIADSVPPVRQVRPAGTLAAPVPSPRGGAGRGRRRAAESNESSDAEPERLRGAVDLGMLDGAPPSRAADLDGNGQEGGTWPMREADGPDEWHKTNLLPCCDHELEFVVRDALNFQAGGSVRSDPKTVNNFRFRILIFPSGTHNTGGLQVSAFVEAEPLEGLDPRWVFHGVKYQIVLVNWLDYRRSVVKSDTWTFSKEGVDRGWHDMVRIADLTPESGWLSPDNSLCFRAQCYVRQADSISTTNGEYNHRKETGCIGLMNHGATCYMNGLLQSLFHVGEFRKIVYSIDWDEAPGSPSKDEPASQDSRGKGDGESESDGKAPNLIHALQNVFYRLQTAEQAVNTKELMKSFGWDTMDAFTQHDAQELNRILCDKVEEHLKGSAMDGSIKRLFEGEMENYIECIDVDYKSRRNETFYDIQLNIKSERGEELRTLEESLREFTNEEVLEGDNAYEAEGQGKQRAKKGIRFLTFPPVLNLQLKRFHFDLEKMDMVKLNTRFEFNRKLDLSPFAPGAGTYLLYGVVVHSGELNSGHYYAYIRPNMDQWVKFDDDAVTPCSEYAAVEDNYGGTDLNTWNYFERSRQELRTATCPDRQRIQNAYMLVYVREDVVQQVLKSPDPMKVNPRMVERCDQEVRMAEQRRREKLEQQSKIRIRLVFERDLCKMTGFWDHAEIPASEHSLRMARDQAVKDLAAEVEACVEVPRANMALFVLHYRNNPRQVRFTFMGPHTQLRAHIPQFSTPHFDTSDPLLTVLCVASKGYDVPTLRWNPRPAGERPQELQLWEDEKVMLLVVKYFCPQSRKVVTLGCYYMPPSDPLVTMVNDGWVAERLRPYVAGEEVAPVPEDPESFSWECWEEFSERDIQPRNIKKSVKSERMWSGDVVVWQPGAKRPDGQDGGAETTPSPEAQVAEGVIAPGEAAPTYPVSNVAELAAHMFNAIDVVVTLHDSHQPLCVDGVVANGVWGAVRPQSAAGKEEKPEDVALSMSPVKFRPAVEKEFKMDLRWLLLHVTGTLAKAFDLKAPAGTAEAQLWLFHAAPANTAEDPLNAQISRSEHTSLKDIQRNVSYVSSTTGKKPLQLHAVELPIQPARQNLESGLCPLCLRFFDGAAREVGSEVIVVSANGTMQDVLAEAAQVQARLFADWGRPKLRCMEVVDGRVHQVCRADTPVRSLLCFGKSNIFYHCLRVEEEERIPEGSRLHEVYHSDRQSQQAFGQPVLIACAPGEKSSAVKARCKEKLQVPDGEFKSWRLVRSGGRTGRTHLKDDEPWDSDQSSDAKLCLEHVHPNPTSTFARTSRYNKPLTIK